MQINRLMYTVVPILLGSGMDTGKVAGRIAKRWGLVSLVFGKRRTLTQLYYTRTIKINLSVLSDAFVIQALRDVAANRSFRSDILALIPCSPDATAFLTAHRDDLETHYVILPCPFEANGQLNDPLAPLIRNDALCPASSLC